MSYSTAEIFINKEKSNKTTHIVFPTEMAEYFGIASNPIPEDKPVDLQKNITEKKEKTYTICAKYKYYVETKNKKSDGTYQGFWFATINQLTQKRIREWILTWKNKDLLPKTIKSKQGKIISILRKGNQIQKSRIYFILCEEMKVIKIGITNDIEKRLNSLQTSNAFPLKLLKIIDGDFQEEKKIHQQFADLRMNGEWFTISEELMTFISNL